MGENNSSETNVLLGAHGSIGDSESGSKKSQLTDQELHRPLVKQLQGLVRLILGISTDHRKNISPRAGTSPNASAVSPSPSSQHSDQVQQP